MRVSTIPLILYLLSTGTVWAQPPRERDPAALVSDGQDAMYRLRYPAAREIFGRIIDEYPESPVGYGMMSVATFNEMVYAASNPVLQEYGAPNPYSSSKIYKSIEEESGRFHEANDRLIAVTGRILEDDPKNVEALYFRGLAEENLAAEAIVISDSKMGAVGPGRKAREFHEKVLELDPNWIDAQVSVAAYEFALATVDGLAKIVIKPIQFFGFFRGDKDKAFALMEEVVAKGRYRSVDAEIVLSVMHAEHGDPNRAVEILRSLGERYPESYLVELNTAAIQELKLKGPREALATYEQLLDSLPGKTPGLGEGEIRFLIGRTHFRLAEYEAARTEFARALTSATVEAETAPLSHYYLGQVFEELGRDEDAKASYREFVRLAGSMESLADEVRQANRKLR